VKKIYTPEIGDFLRCNVKGRSVKELTSMVNSYFGLSFTEQQIITAKNIYGLRGGCRSTLTLEQRKFLEENIRGKPLADLMELFNREFQTNFNATKIKNFCTSNKLKNGLPRVKGGHYWTKAEISFLKKYGKENANKELTVLFNNAFNSSLTRRQIKYACLYNKIKIREQAPVKCTEEIAAFIKENPNETYADMTVMINNTFGTDFKKKQVYAFAKNLKYKVLYKNNTHEAPLGTERVKRLGHIFVKVFMDGPYKKRWQEKHRLVWEQAHGKIPKGMEIMFLDTNPLNCDLENLVLVSKAEKLLMAQYKLRFENRECTLAGLAVVKHQLAMHGRLKEMLGTQEHKLFISREFAKRKREKLRSKRGTAKT